MKNSFLKIILPFSVAVILLSGGVLLYSYSSQVKDRNELFEIARVLDDCYQLQLIESRLSAEAYHFAATGQGHNLEAYKNEKENYLLHLGHVENTNVRDVFEPTIGNTVNSANYWLSSLDSMVVNPFFDNKNVLEGYLQSPAFAELRKKVSENFKNLEDQIVAARELRMKDLSTLTKINMVGFGAVVLLALFVLIFTYRINAAHIRQSYQLQLQQKQREFEVAFQHAPIGKAIIDRQGYCTEVNQSLCELLHYDEATLTKKRFADLSTPEEYEEDLRAISRLIQGDIKTHEREKQFLTSKGDPIWVRQSMSFVRHEDGSPRQLIVQLNDITAEKESRRQLQESNTELEQFAYTASHDLKEPLRMIDGFMKLLEKNYGDKLDENGKKYIHFATDGARRMNLILEDLLQYSRAGRIGTDPELVDVNEMMAEIKELYKPLLEQKNAVLEWEPLPQVMVPRTALRTVLQNLVSNALKYQPAGNQPVIKIRADVKSRYWKFVVNDNGIGIKPEYFEKIFILFKRLHGKTEYEGSGIGLATCKRLVEKWGGKMGVNSEEGKGSDFCFTIPKKENLNPIV